MIKRTIALFGDSILKGIVQCKQNNRYRLLPEARLDELGETYQLELLNKARFGCTIAKGRELVEKFVGSKPASQYIILEFGGNDCDFDWASISAEPDRRHLPKTPLETFERIYRELIDWLRQRHFVPILMNLPPIDAVHYFQQIVKNGAVGKRVLHWLGDVQRIYRFQELYSLTVERIAAATGAMLIDIRSAFLTHPRFQDLICEDGIHPNEDGHRLMEESVRTFLNSSQVQRLLQAPVT